MITNVFEELGFDADEAANLKARSGLMHAIKAEIRRREWTQTEAAEYLHTSQPRVNDLMRGKIQKFGLDALVNLATECGLEVSVTTKHKEPA